MFTTHDETNFQSELRETTARPLVSLSPKISVLRVKATVSTYTPVNNIILYVSILIVLYFD